MKNNLKKIREEQSISFSNCVKMTGIPETTLKRYEHGQTPNGMEYVIRLADFYGVSMDDIFECEDNFRKDKER